MTLITVTSLLMATTVTARESSEDNGNVVVNEKGNVILVMLCDPEASEQCLCVHPDSGKPRYVGIRESDNLYTLLRYDNGTPVARIVRVAAKVWKVR